MEQGTEEYYISKQLHEPNSSTCFVEMIKSKILRWMVHVARMEKWKVHTTY